MRDPDIIMDHIPDQCDACPNRDICINKRVINTQYEYDIVMKSVITKHVVHERICPLDNGNTLRGTSPLSSTHEYGNYLKSFCVLLYAFGTVSYDRISELVEGLFDITISPSTVYDFMQKCSDNLEPTIELIKKRLIESPIGHFDETGFNINGKNHWIHTVSNGNLTYLSVQEKRGYEGMMKTGIHEYFKGKAIHDYWKAYYKFENMIHALCNAHILRELLERFENTGQEWPKKMRDLLKLIKSRKDEILESGGDSFSEEEFAGYLFVYDNIVAEGLDLNPIPLRISGTRGRNKKGKSICLLERFRDRRDEILRFATDFSVPFDNNTAERALRGSKNRQKISGCMRTIEGATAYCDVLSYLQSTRSFGTNAVEAITHVFKGTSLSLMKSYQPTY
jgi:transposase